MTTTTVSKTTAQDGFLRFAMRLDAVISGLVGIVGLAIAPRLAEWSGTTPTFEYALSAFFVAYGLAVLGLAVLPSVRTWGAVIAIGNVVFTVAAVLLVVLGVMPLTVTGIVLTLGSGVFTLVMADLQYLGLRRMK